jgi:GTP1/Obg family GTP-binding protein
MDEHPPVSQLHILVYVARRLDALEALHKDQADDIESLRRDSTVKSRMSLLHIIVEFLRWSGVVSTQVSTVFIAGYVAIEHSWYVTKITKFVTALLGIT